MGTEVGGATYVIDARVEGAVQKLEAFSVQMRQVNKEADRVAKQGAMAVRNFGGSLQVLMGGLGDPAKVAGTWAKATGQLVGDMDRFAEQAKRQGISFAEMTQRLIHFRSEGYRARRGTGELYEALKQYDAEAAVMIRMTSTQAQREAILNSVLERTTDATARARIQAAAFGLSMEKAGKQAGLMSGGIGMVGKSIAGLLTVAAARQAVTGIMSAVKAVGDIGDLAANIGMTTDQVQELQYAFARTGIGAEESGAGLQRYADQLAEARRGQGEFYELLKANNVALTNQDGSVRSSYDVLLAFSNLVRNAATAEDALNMAVMLFGRTAGRQFVEALRDGGDGLKALGIEAQNTGVVISGSQIKAADQIEARYNSLIASLKSSWQQFAVFIADSFASLQTTTEDYARATAGKALDAQITAQRAEVARLKASLDQSTSRAKVAFEQQLRQAEGVLRVLERARPTTAAREPSQLPASPVATGKTERQFPETKTPTVSEKFIADLQEELTLLKLNNTERRIREALAKAGVAADSAQGQEIAALIRKQEALKASQDAAKDAEKEAAQSRSEAAREAEQASAAIDQYIASLNDEVAALRLELATAGLTDGAKARAAAMSKLAAGATDEQRRAAEQAADAIKSLTDQLKYQEVGEEFLKQEIEQAAEAQRQKTESVAEASDFMAGELSSAFDGIIQKSESVTDAFKRMAFNIIEAMTQAVMFGKGPFADLLNMSGSGGGSGGGGGWLGDLISGLFKPSAPTSLYATGGRVAPKKEIGVGEEGPEYFVPDDKRQPVRLLGAKGPETFTPDGPGVIVPNEQVMTDSAAFRQIADRPIDTPEGVAPPLAEAMGRGGVSVETPAAVTVPVVPPQPVDVPVNAPRPVDVQVNQPPPVTPSVSAPPPASIDVQQPAAVTVPVVQPDAVRGTAVPPAPVRIPVDQPEPVAIDVHKPAPIEASAAAKRGDQDKTQRPFISAERFFALFKERPRPERASEPVAGQPVQQRGTEANRAATLARSVQAPSVRDRLQSITSAARGPLIPADAAQGSMASPRESSVKYAPVYHIDARGAQVGFAAEIRKQLDDRDRENSRRFAGQVIDNRQRRKF